MKGLSFLWVPNPGLAGLIYPKTQSGRLEETDLAFDCPRTQSGNMLLEQEPRPNIVLAEAIPCYLSTAGTKAIPPSGFTLPGSYAQVLADCLIFTAIYGNGWMTRTIRIGAGCSGAVAGAMTP